MGTAASKIDERLCRPTGLYDTSNVNLPKLRRDIKRGTLAACLPGKDAAEAGGGGGEECPICFLQYPTLNRSLCCKQSICTECYIMVSRRYAIDKTQRQIACPFCKASPYKVVYKGKLTEQERAAAVKELQKVAEAKRQAAREERRRGEERAREIAARRASGEEIDIDLSEYGITIPGGPAGPAAGASMSYPPPGHAVEPYPGTPGYGSAARSPVPDYVLANSLQYWDHIPQHIMEAGASPEQDPFLEFEVDLDTLLVHHAILASLQNTPEASAEVGDAEGSANADGGEGEGEAAGDIHAAAEAPRIDAAEMDRRLQAAMEAGDREHFGAGDASPQPAAAQPREDEAAEGVGAQEEEEQEEAAAEAAAEAATEAAAEAAPGPAAGPSRPGPAEAPPSEALPAELFGGAPEPPSPETEAELLAAEGVAEEEGAEEPAPPQPSDAAEGAGTSAPAPTPAAPASAPVEPPPVADQEYVAEADLDLQRRQNAADAALQAALRETAS